MTCVKFCGLSRSEDIAAVNILNPDYAGFVFWEKSRRYVAPETAKMLSDKLNPDIVPVGVFLDSDLNRIIDIANTGCIRTVQLHGSEDEGFVRETRDATGMPVIRAFRIATRNDLEKAISTEADLMMLDGGIGEGRTFDWTLLEDVKRPYILAGGLNPENVMEAIERLHPFGVDVSSGIETDGIKDQDKMKRFMEAVDSARHSNGGA